MPAESNLVAQLNYGVQAMNVITTPIDQTLTESGAAADAKATGDAIQALQEYMGSGTLPGTSSSLLEALTAIYSTIGSTDLPGTATTITGALATIAAAMGDGITGSTLTEAITAVQTLLGNAALPLSASTVTEALNVILAAAVRSVNGQVPDENGAVTVPTGVMTVNGQEPDANGNIEVQTGLDNLTVNGQAPDENGAVTVPTGVMTINGQEPDENGNFEIGEPEGIVKSVNGETPDENGDVSLNRVPFADDLYTEDTQEINGSFICRTSGGSASIADSTVLIKKIYGRSDREGYVPTSREMSVSWGEHEAGQEAIVAAINWDTFIAQVGGTTTEMEITYDGEDWDYTLADYGISITSGTPVEGDVIRVAYVAEERGEITNTDPVSFSTTGWNLYDNSTGYARVVRYNEQYGYRIDGAYSSLKFCTEQGGTETEVTVDENGLFNVAADGWIHVTGGNDTTTAIYTTWSDWEEGTPEEFEAYVEYTIPLRTAISQIFAAGMCSVGNVRDEISPQNQTYVRRINRVEYSAANLEAVIAGGTDYTYDTEYIYYVLAEPISGSYTMENNLPVSSHGLEFFDAETAVDCVFVYTQALKDKLRRNVLTISAQELTDTQKKQVTDNIGAARYHVISLDMTTSSAVTDLVDAMIAQMTEDGTYVFSGSWNNWSYGYDAFCVRTPYRNDGIGYSGAIYARAGAAWTFDARSSDGKATVVELVDEYHSGAGYHNSKYRGKNLGHAVTTEQWAEIGAGTFRDLYVGDHWVINDITWYIAGFDYWYNQGDQNCTTHHVVIVPWNPLAQGPMNNTITTEGGYVGSDYYTGANNNTLRATADAKIKAAFGASHLLTHREFLSNAITNGYPSSGAWYDSTFELMTEQMVYGSRVYASKSAGSNLSNDVTLGYGQLPLFQHNKWMACNRSYSWLRDIATASYFVGIGSFGVPGYYQASNGLYIRPAFGIKA